MPFVIDTKCYALGPFLSEITEKWEKGDRNSKVRRHFTSKAERIGATKFEKQIDCGFVITILKVQVNIRQVTADAENKEVAP